MVGSNRGRVSDLFLLVGIIALATFLRVYRLNELPPGLHYDEAFKGVEARQVLAGYKHPIFFGDNMGEDPMRIYATAVNFLLFGDSPWSLRLVSAWAGILMVAAVYPLARALFRSRGTALLAAFGLAILYWSLNFSRLGMEPILTPLMMALAFAFLWRGVRRDAGPAAAGAWKKSAGWFGLAGVCLGATQYTYQAALFVPILVTAYAVVELAANRDEWRRHWVGLVILAGAALLVVAPLSWFWATHLDLLLERPGAVTQNAAGSAPLVENAVRVAGMFLLRGDENPRSNLPLRPVLDPFLAAGFIAGLVWCVVRIRQTEARFLLLWLGVMVLPSVLTDYAPHFGRSVGAMPAVALLAAQGIRQLATRLPVPHNALLVVLVAGLATSTYATFHDYFDVWGTRTGLYDSFDVGYLQLAQELKAQPKNETVYLSPVAADNFTIAYGLAGREAHSFDGRQALVVPPSETTAVYGIVTREDPHTLARLRQVFPTGSVIKTLGDLTGKPAGTIFRSAGTPQLAPQKTVGARIGSPFALRGYDLDLEEGTLRVSLYWESRGATRENYTVFVHLIGALNPATQSTVWAQDDAQPGHNTYPTSQWHVGEVVIDEYRLTLLPDTPRGKYEIEIGMYLAANGERLKVTDSDGKAMDNDRVLTDAIELP